MVGPVLFGDPKPSCAGGAVFPSLLPDSLFRRAGRVLLASVVFPATLLPAAHDGLPSPIASGTLSVLPLPPGARIRSSVTFGTGAPGRYYFLDDRHRLRLFRLSLEHPMGARDLWRERWESIPVPALPIRVRLRAAAIGQGHLFLSGEGEGGAPFIRSYQIGTGSGERGDLPALTGEVDYFPEKGEIPVRRLLFDDKARILWMGYDSGRIESGTPYLVLHDRILWSDPAGYLPLPRETSLAKGPPPLLTPKSLLKSKDPCFSCRFYLTARKEPEGQSIVNDPVRSPSSVDSALGMLPLGGGRGLFMGSRSYVCRVPHASPEATLSHCLRVSAKDLPVAGIWWGNSLTYLYPPGRFSGGERRWTIVSVNPAVLADEMMRLPSGGKFPFLKALKTSGRPTFLPVGASPRVQTFTTDGRTLVLFGRTHFYRLNMESEKNRAQPGPFSR